jgi:Domain of unknown function (DUF4397)/Secretion system C-terminal sorting domain
MRFLTLLLLAAIAFVSNLSAQTARVQIIHNSPDPTVDVYAGGQILLNDFAFRTASGYVTVPAGLPIPIAVAPASSTSAADALVTTPVTFDANKTYIVTASGIVMNTLTPFFLNSNGGTARETASNPAKVDLTILHGSPDAPAVDIAVRNVGNIASNLSYPNYTSYVSVDPGVYYIDVKPTGSNNIVQTYRADLSGFAGSSFCVFASGFLAPAAGQPAFGLFAAAANGDVLELPAAPVASVQIIHNSPSPTVDVYVNGQITLNDFAYRTATPYVFLPAGQNLSVAVALGNSTSVADALVTFPGVNFNNGQTYTVSASGIVNNPTTPFTLAVNPNTRSKSSDPTKHEFNVYHGATDAPPVDVSLFNATTNLVSNLAYGSYSDYIAVDPGVYYVSVKLAGTSTIVGTYKADLSMPAGQAITVMASGFAAPATGDPAFGLFAVLSSGMVAALPAEVPPTTARLQVIHNSPSPTVDIYINGELRLDNFEYQDATPFITVPADVTLEIGVALGNSTSVNDALVVIPVVLDANSTNVAVASGIVGNAATPFALNLNRNGRESAASAGAVDIAVLHGSPNAPNVDINEFYAGDIITDLTYGEVTGYLSLPPAIYDLSVRVAGTQTTVATYRADLSGLAGGAAYVFASGLVGNATTPFGVYAALANGTVIALPLTPMSDVQVIHNSPEPTVDVYLNQRLLIEDFAFRSASPFVQIPASRDFTVGIAPANAPIIYTSPTLSLDASKDYTVFAGGIVGNAATPFNLYVFDDARQTAAAGQVAFSVFHGSPDAPEVDVDERLLGNLVSDVSFGENTPYLDVPADAYVIDIKPAGADQIVASYIANLTGLGGAAARVFASGLLGGTPAFGLFAALPDGTVVELPAVETARMQLIHNAPSPTVDLYLGGEIFIDDFEFRTATEFFYVPAGEVFTVGVALGNSNGPQDIVANIPFDLDNGGTYIAVASGILGNAATPFEVVTIEDARERATSQTQVQLAIFHGAPDAPAVDIVPVGSSTALLSDITYKEYIEYVDFATNQTLSFDIVPTASPNTVVRTYSLDLSGGEGEVAFIFASGLLGGQPDFDLWAAFPDGTTLPVPGAARTQIIHNSPSPTVDVYINNELRIEDFEFRDATPYILLPTDEIFNVGIAPAGGNIIYTSPDLELDNSKSYTVMATGVVGDPNTPFGLRVNENARFRASNTASVDLVLYHGAPDAPEVDVTLPTGTPIFDNIEYGEFSNYLSVPPASYTINLTPSTDNANVLAKYLADISGLTGGSATIFASGFFTPTGTEPALQVWVALPDGTTFPLPIVSSTNELPTLDQAQIAPNPVNSVLNLNMELSEATDLRFRIMDVAGRTIQDGNWGMLPSGNNTQQIEVSRLLAGTYFLELLGANGQQTLKFSVQR